MSGGAKAGASGYAARMPILVQKFGGTSVADAPRIHLAARKAVRAKREGNQVVLVVSAMGHTTDRLVELAYQVSRRPSKREMDMLISTGEQVSIALMAMAIHEAGFEAISLTGAQVGLRTDSQHSRARIQSIDAPRVHRLLDEGRIVIVAGFQGVDPDFNITTLGRGGSDTTAVALAAALGAVICEIYTDVDGVYTCDPRLVAEARKLDHITYDEMLELASRGAGVMHARSIELGKKFNVPIHVRSSFSDHPGTMIVEQFEGMEDVVIRAASLKPNIGRIAFVELPNEPGLAAEVFGRIASQQIIVDDIIQTVYDGGRRATIAFTVDAADLGRAQATAELLLQRYPGARVETTDNLATICIVGIGMRSHSGVAAMMFEALRSAGVAIENISTSEIVVSAVVQRKDAERALSEVHRVFELQQA